MRKVVEQVPSDPQPCERQMYQKTASASAKAGDSNQSLGIAGSVDTPPFVQPNPPNNRSTNMIAPDPSLHVTGGVSGPSPPGTILVSSREVTYSQVS